MTVAVDADDRVEDLVDQRHRGDVGRADETSAFVDALREATSGSTVGKHDVSANSEEPVVLGRREPCVTGRLAGVHEPTFTAPVCALPEELALGAPQEWQTLRSRDAAFHL